jgi:hypothetical protein
VPGLLRRRPGATEAKDMMCPSTSQWLTPPARRGVARSLNGGVVVEHEHWDVLLPRERDDLITLAAAAQRDVFKPPTVLTVKV